MKFIRGVLAVVVGLVAGGAVNMALIQFGSHLIPPPEGVDVTDVEQIREGLHLFQPRHFLVPFLAHALGTLVGATVASVIAMTARRWVAGIIGFFFLAGGISMVFIMPAPVWFVVVDLGLAYLPMAWVGGRLGEKLRSN